MGVGNSCHDPNHTLGSGLPPGSSIAHRPFVPLSFLELSINNACLPYDLASRCDFGVGFRTTVSLRLRGRLEFTARSLIQFGQNLASRHNRLTTKGSPNMIFDSKDCGFGAQQNNWALCCPDNEKRRQGCAALPPPSKERCQTFYLQSPHLSFGGHWKAYFQETLDHLEAYYEVAEKMELCELLVTFDPVVLTRDYKRIAQAIIHFEPVLDQVMYSLIEGNGRGEPRRQTSLRDNSPSLKGLPSKEAILAIDRILYTLDSNGDIDFRRKRDLFKPGDRWSCLCCKEVGPQGETTRLQVIWRVPISYTWSTACISFAVAFVGSAISCSSVQQLLQHTPNRRGLEKFIKS